MKMGGEPPRTGNPPDDYGNHFKLWRFKNEQIYFGNNSKEKTNMILAVGKDKAYNYKITEENVNTNIFLKFLNELNDISQDNKEKKYLLILDNLKIHKTEEVFKFL